MSDNPVRTRQQQMRETLEAAAHLVYVMPDGPHQFQKHIIEADQPQAASIDALAHLISLANAALMVSNNSADSTYGPWYYDKAQRLLERAIDVLAVIEADREPRPAAGLN